MIVALAINCQQQFTTGWGMFILPGNHNTWWLPGTVKPTLALCDWGLVLLTVLTHLSQSSWTATNSFNLLPYSNDN